MHPSVLDSTPAAAALVAVEPGTVGAVVLEFLMAQRAALTEGETRLRNGEPAVHPTRVGIRRFRSALRVFSALFEDDLTVPLDGELQWYALVLGEVRDREVQRERLASAIAGLAPELVRGPVAEDIEMTLRSEQEAAEAEVLRQLDGPRYRALLSSLDEWLAQPPLTAKAGRRAGKVNSYVVRAESTVVKKLAAALESGDDEELHSARKAGKRARYATELASDLAGPAARHALKRFTAVQTELGEFQDSAVAAALLLRLADLAALLPDRDGFTYGVLYGQELARAQAARSGATRLMADLLDQR